MESDLTPKTRHNVKSMTEQRYSQVGDFAKKLVKEHGALIASLVVNRPEEARSDIRLAIIIDDLNQIILTPKAMEIRMAAEEMAYRTTLPLKCETLLASDFWNRFRARDAQVRDLARFGLVVHDNGFLLPIQDLLVTGKIRPSKESVDIYYVKAERAMKSANDHVKRAVVDLYWAVTDAAHAAVMLAGITPPSPAELSGILKSEFVARNLIHRRCVEVYDRVFDAAKKVMHRQVFDMSGRDFDSFLADADFFVKEMRSFVDEYAGSPAAIHRK
ncbi:hypothetical protein KY362_02760 [Candidatus Woesearchaeota archaeon]|nr:hypothetical protein [Candidatus Woesearchaeota archaeon]